jgi:uncharacterized repeat protein (TIGR01451 family)
VTRATDLHPDLTDERSNVMLATAPAAAALSVAIAGTPDPVATGTPVTYVVTARNAGPASAEATALALALPAGVTPTAVSTGIGTCEIAAQPGVVSCRLGSLAVDAEVEMTVRATVTATPGSTLVAHAALISDTWNPDGTPVVARTSTEVVGG